MPGLSTKHFLKLLKTITKLSVYGFCDPDPSGVEILAVYARGSMESAYVMIISILLYPLSAGLVFSQVTSNILSSSQR